MTDDKPSSDDGAEDVNTGDLRASDADREQVVEILRDATGDGRLTAEEHDERVEAALKARFVSELAALTRDLPNSPVEQHTPSAGAPQPKDVVEINQRWGTLQRSGSWVVPRRLDIRMHGGDVKLDFTEAAISHDVLDIDVDLGIGGNLILIVRPGVAVTTGELTVGVGEVKNRQPAADAETPVELRVNVTGRVRGGDVVIRHPRRTLGQWVRGESAL
ncbi:DUF1707 domain-containing protein [Streptomyces sp. NPDC020800]|uniref:DUF1707 domain-containing protein n=1 Tax=Streptomyces sp. NPDC020800 TaxID=3365092 RepID=UPI0037A8F76B